MGDWNRSTREVLFENLSPQMQQAIQKHLQTWNLGPILTDYTMCVETVHEKKKKGLFGGGGSRLQCAVITPQWLLLVEDFGRDGAVASSVPLADCVITDYADTPGYKLIPDSGLEVSGAFTGQVGIHGEKRVSMFVGLGGEPAAKKFQEEVFKAFQAARK